MNKRTILIGMFMATAAILPTISGGAQTMPAAERLLAGLGFSTSSRPAPEMTVTDLSGKRLTLSSLKGKTVLLNFWATWCPPCRMEMPSMQRLHAAMDPDKFVIVAVNLGETSADVRKFIQKSGYTFPIYLDPDQQAGNTYRIDAIPSTFLIDRRGTIIGTFLGAREWDTPDVINAFSQVINTP